MIDTFLVYSQIQQQQQQQPQPQQLSHAVPGPSSTVAPRQKNAPGAPAAGGGTGADRPGDFVPKVLVEEKEQEILTKEETIQVGV